MQFLMKLVMSLFLFTGYHSVDAQRVGGCVDAMTTSLKNGAETCDAMQAYVKCILRETDLHKSMTTDEAIASFKSQFESGLTAQGLNCSVDIKALVEELKEDDKKGVTQTTRQPKEYQHATTIGDCIDTLISEKVNHTTCTSLTPYLKCVIRVMERNQLVENYTNDNYSSLKKSIINELSKLGLECDIDVASLVKEIRREENGENITDGSQTEESGSNVGGGSGENGSDLGARPFHLVAVVVLTFISVVLLH